MTIKKAILHILGSSGAPLTLSRAELDIDSEACETFILKHVKKMINNPAARTALFKPDSAVYKLLGDYQSGAAFFMDTGNAVSSKLQESLSAVKGFPPADLLLAHVADKGAEYFAITVLPYQETYVRQSKDADNQIAKGRALPFSSGKAEYACLIGLDGVSMPIGLIEKEDFFSALFLECDASPSKKEQAQLINEINDEFVQEYHENNPKVTARIRKALVEEAEAEEGFVSMDNVAASVFADNEQEKTQYISTMREAGIASDLPLGERVARTHFATQRIVGDNGIEIKFPALLAADEDELEIIPHSDGTITVTIKRLRIRS
ncbi:MAG: nucleoid-associated protein [Defluviitaleaceae bacterium]|nr:nucleoid-associated protein [Defluviitaleaceae bacterium]